MESIEKNLSASKQDDMDLLSSVMRDAATLSLEYFKNEFDHWKKDDNTPVSEADMAVNQLLKNRLI